MNTSVFKIVGLTACLVLAGVAIFVFSPKQNKLTRITVVGDSHEKVSPDTAVVTFSVLTQGKQALDAQQENARKSEAVKQAVETLELKAKPEVKTSDYSLSPQQDYYSGKMPKILGYEVKNTVTVSVAALDQVGAIIDAATKAGANSVDGIRFVVGEASPAQGDALEMATKQAMGKAESIARSLNGKIVRVIETSEGGVPVRPLPENEPLFENASTNTAMKVYKTPVEAGTINMNSQVVLVVEIAI